MIERIQDNYTQLLEWIESGDLKLFETYRNGLESVNEAIQEVF
jgi:NADPH-dependent curcumin reductase CurA